MIDIGSDIKDSYTSVVCPVCGSSIEDMINEGEKVGVIITYNDGEADTNTFSSAKHECTDGWVSMW